MAFTRRSALHAGSALLGSVLAGCLRSGPGTPSETGLPKETGTPSPSARTTASGSTAPVADPVSLAVGESYGTDDGVTTTIENVSVRAAVVDCCDTHPDPVYAEDGQFVVADAVVSGRDGPDPATLSLSVRTDTLHRSGRYYVSAETNEGDVRQRFGFPVPASPAPSEGAIVWTREDGSTIRWELPPTVLSSIPRRPRFELRDFEARDVSGDEIEVALTVENVGYGDATFLAEVGNAATSDQPEVAVTVPAGETVSASRRVWADFGDRDEMTVVLRWRDGALERTIRKS